MPALLDPSVHRDADAYVGHLVAMLDAPDDEEWLTEINDLDGIDFRSGSGTEAPRCGEDLTT